MEIVALNARLRGDFSALLKLLPSPHAVSSLSNLKHSILHTISPTLATSSDLYTEHCRLMLWRLNSYQYDSTSAFLLDLEQLERVVESSPIKQQVKKLLDRLVVFEREKQGEESLVKVSNQCGTIVPLGSSLGVRGLQEVASIGSEEEETGRNTMWLCNLTVNHQIVTLGTFQTKEEAVQGYEERRKSMAENAQEWENLTLLAAKMEEEQEEKDMRVLKEAVAQCHPRLTTMKVTPVTASTSAPSVNNLPLTPRGPPRVVTKNISADAASSLLKPSFLPSEIGESPKQPKRPRAENSVRAASSSKKQKVGSHGNDAASSASVRSRSYLKLRRLIQKRLCRHLKGKEVCVLSNPDQLDGRLQPSGRLEAGKVFSFRRKKQMTFADYVCDELGRAESACAHMFLIRSKESIDDHLKVCDSIADKKRESTCNHARSKKALRQTH